MTISLVYPMLGKLLAQIEPDQPVHFHDEATSEELFSVKPELLDEAILNGRQELHAEILKRFYDKVQESDLEDTCIATMLDPRCELSLLYLYIIE